VMNAAADRPGNLSDPPRSVAITSFRVGGSVSRRIFAVAAMRAKVTGCGAIATISPQSADRAASFER